MAVYDQSYRAWSGKLQSRVSRIVAMVGAGLRQPFRSFLIKLVVIFFYFLMGFWLFILYMVLSAPKAPPVALGNMIYRHMFFNFPLFPILIGVFAAAVGSPLIARDLQHNALTFYFSKAITRGDYVLSKYLTTILLLLSVTLGPVLLLFGGQMLMGMEKIAFVEQLRDLWAVTAHSFIIVLPMSAAILALSAISKRPYVGGILWTVIYFASMAASGVLQKSIHRDWCELVSWQNDCAQLAEFLYHDRSGKLMLLNLDVPAPKPHLTTGWLPPLIILGAVTVISLAWVRWRVRSAESGE